MSVAVIVHVFYPEFWDELARCIRRIGPSADLFITYMDEAAVADARRDFPTARFVQCENRGYDIWPFLKVLRTIRPDDYDCIVKLHTKRDVDGALPVLNHAWLGGGYWRRNLLSFVATNRNWRRTQKLLTDPRVGMVAGRRVVFRRGDLPPALDGSFDRARAELGKLTGLTAPETAEYVAGTMFAVRPEVLQPIAKLSLDGQSFDPPAGHQTETYAHLWERLLGFLVQAQGRRIAAADGSLFWRRLYYGRSPLGKLLRFIFEIKYSARSRMGMVRAFRLPVWRMRMPVAATRS